MFDEFERVEVQDERTKLHCNACERRTIHSLEAKCQGSWDDPVDPVNGGQDFSIYRCGACDEVCYITRAWNSESLTHDANGNLEYDYDIVQHPVPIAKDFLFEKDYTPSGLDSLLDDVSYSFSANRYTLATIALRMCVEFIMKDQKAAGSNLQKKIDWLQQNKLVNGSECALLQKVREKGNASAHEAAAMSQAELIGGMQILNALIDKLYGAPGRQADAVLKASKALQPSQPKST